jgi:hypothetical protein
MSACGELEMMRKEVVAVSVPVFRIGYLSHLGSKMAHDVAVPTFSTLAASNAFLKAQFIISLTFPVLRCIPFAVEAASLNKFKELRYLNQYSDLSYGLDDRGSISGRDRDLFSSPPRPDRFWDLPSLLSYSYRENSPRG